MLWEHKFSGGLCVTETQKIFGTSVGGQQNMPPGGMFASDWWRDHATLSNSLYKHNENKHNYLCSWTQIFVFMNTDFVFNKHSCV